MKKIVFITLVIGLALLVSCSCLGQLPPMTGYVDDQCQWTMFSIEDSGLVKIQDNCPEDLVVTQSPPEGTILGVGLHDITLTAVDGSGNTSVVYGTVAVIDTTAPLITIEPLAYAIPEEDAWEYLRIANCYFQYHADWFLREYTDFDSIQNVYKWVPIDYTVFNWNIKIPDPVDRYKCFDRLYDE